MNEFEKGMTMLLIWLGGMCLVGVCQWIIIYVIQLPLVICGAMGGIMGVMFGGVFIILTDKIRKGR